MSIAQLRGGQTHVRLLSGKRRWISLHRRDERSRSASCGTSRRDSLGLRMAFPRVAVGILGAVGRSSPRDLEGEAVEALVARQKGAAHRERKPAEGGPRRGWNSDRPAVWISVGTSLDSRLCRSLGMTLDLGLDSPLRGSLDLTVVTSTEPRQRRVERGRTQHPAMCPSFVR
jgi:hypothetical protein